MKQFTKIFLCLLVLTLFVACSSEKKSSKNEYVVDVKGYAEEGFKIITSIGEDGKITDIAVGNNKETEGVGSTAIEQLPTKIIDAQSIAIDTVAGATVTSEALITGVEKAIEMAGLNIENYKKVPEKIKGEDVEKVADVVIIGSGGAGMSAAVEAIEAGNKVIVLEKMPAIGGNTILAASAMNAANPDEQRKQKMPSSQIQTIQDNIDAESKDPLMAKWQAEVKADLEKYKADNSDYLYDSPAFHKLQTYVDGDFVANPKLIEVFGDNALDSVEWLTSLGAGWNPGTTAAVGALWPRSHTPTKDLGSAGANFVMPQKKIIEEKGGEILLGYKAEELIMDNGRVTGVKGTTSDGAQFIISANKGVVLATGGFAANPEMREKYNKQWAKAGADVPTTNPVSATGEGLIMAETIGANLIDMEWIQMVTFSKSAITAAIDNSLQVNQSGLRFIREDGRRDEICQAILEQEGGYCYRIYDGHTITDQLKGISYKGVPVEEYVGKGAYMSDTLEGLAKELDIPTDVLKKTVEEFNGYVENGNDPTGRMLFNNKIEKGPYYAVKYIPHFHHTMGGVQIDELARVLDNKGNAIPGLYAAGEVTGGIHGSNRLGGNAISDIITFGRIAGTSVSEQK